MERLLTTTDPVVMVFATIGVLASFAVCIVTAAAVAVYLIHRNCDEE